MYVPYTPIRQRQKMPPADREGSIARSLGINKKKKHFEKKNLSKQLPRIQRIGRDTLATARPQAEIAPLGEPLYVLLGAGVVPAGLASPQVGPDLVGADELPVLVDDGAAEGTLEDDDFALRIEVLVKRFFLF